MDIPDLLGIALGKIKYDNTLILDIETTGFGSESRITCISVKLLDSNPVSFCLDSEERLIKEFFQYLLALEGTILLVTYGGVRFDYKVIRKRTSQYSLFMELNWFNKLHKSDLAQTTNGGLEGKTGDGKLAIKLWKEKRIDELIEYCENDVLLTEKLYLKSKEGVL